MDHAKLERHGVAFAFAILGVASLGGLFEIAPLFTIENTVERVQGMRPYTPLELAGRDIYVREGCYACHSQMIRTLRSDVERYGHFSLAAESMYDHPFQWGSKRTGPDLARVGGRYSDEWHVQHLIDPRSVVPESIMPPYAFLADRELDFEHIDGDLQTLRTLGVPYDDAMVENAAADFAAQVDIFGDASGIRERYGDVQIRDFDGDPSRITEMDALVAYLQMLGTLVDFESAQAPEESR